MLGISEKASGLQGKLGGLVYNAELGVEAVAVMAPAPPSRSGNRGPSKPSNQGPSVNVLSLEGSLPQSRAGSRPGTNARGRTPSTAGGPRTGNMAAASRGGTGAGQGLSSDREALMGALVHKMREKFHVRVPLLVFLYPGSLRYIR